MVCLGYKAPDTLDPKLLDPKYVFEDVDAARGGQDGNAVDNSQNIGSLKKLLGQKRAHRGGYADDKVALLYEKCDFIDFL